ALILTAASSGLAVAHAVELAFAVSASTFCPLLLLGIWWRGLTAPGAIAGLVVGGGLSTAAVVAATVGVRASGFAADLLAQPALGARADRVRGRGGGLARPPPPPAGPRRAHPRPAAHPRGDRRRPRRFPGPWRRRGRARLTVRRTGSTARRRPVALS